MGGPRPRGGEFLAHIPDRPGSARLRAGKAVNLAELAASAVRARWGALPLSRDYLVGDGQIRDAVGVPRRLQGEQNDYFSRASKSAEGLPCALAAARLSGAGRGSVLGCGHVCGRRSSGDHINGSREQRLCGAGRGVFVQRHGSRGGRARFP
jgi:hypothetical protein